MRYSIHFQKKLLGICIIILIFSGSCKKFIQIEASPNQIEAGAVFSNDQTVNSAVAGLYVQMRQGTAMTNIGATLYTGLSADEIYNTSPSSTADPFYTNSLLSNNATVNGSFWSSSYVNIYKVNAILEGLGNSTTISDSVKQQLSGEMKVVRALYYFYLVNLFGDVPLITSTDYQVNAIKPRTPVAEIYQQIIEDLKDAETLLKSGYPVTGRARPNKWAATALLARVYLYMGDWINAESEATKVITAGVYNLNLPSGLGNTFLSNSSETIWQIASDVANTAEASSFVPSSSTVKPAYAITGNLLSAFETGDLRKTAWLNKNTISGQDYYYPAKYKNRNSTPVTEYYVVLRLAEQYLIRAESRSQQGNISGAQVDLNIIRNRAGLSNTSAATQIQLVAAIQKERQIELFSEWGHRWLDLKRTNSIDTVLNIIKAPNWQSVDALYPIPFAQLQINVFLTQNPGY